MYESLLKHLEKYIKLNPEEQKLLLSVLQYKKIVKKDFLLKEGQTCLSNFFVLSGCFRLYHIKDTGSEQILQFGIPDWWICDYQSFENKTASDYYIQAIENSEVAILDRNLQQDLFDKIPLIERYFRLMVQRAYSASLKRIQYIFCQSAEERYYQFSSSFPEFVQLIPQYMLASFLGFTPEFLSIIRAKKQK